MIIRISIDESVMITILYDELQRKAWARKAAKGEPIKILEEARVKCLPQIDLAKPKVRLVTKAAGLQYQSDGAAASSAPSVVSALSDAEAAVSKQISLAPQLTRQAEASMRNMNNQRNQNRNQGQKRKHNGGNQNYGGGGRGNGYQNHGGGGRGNGQNRGGGKSNKGRGGGFRMHGSRRP